MGHNILFEEEHCWSEIPANRVSHNTLEEYQTLKAKMEMSQGENILA